MKPHFKMLTSGKYMKMLLVHMLLLLLLTLRSSSNKIGAHWLKESPLSQAFSELLRGPLSSSWVFIVCDACGSDTLELQQILIGPNAPSVFVYQSNTNIESENNEGVNEGINKVLPPTEVQKGWSVAVLVIDSNPTWLQSETISWYFNSVVIINTNSSYDIDGLLNDQMIRRARNIVVLEHITIKGDVNVQLFSSKPFAKPNESLKLFMGLWDKNVFSDLKHLFVDRFSNFNGETLHIASDADDFPLVAAGDEERAPYGMCIEIVDAFSYQMNFTYTTTSQSLDGLWGELENGSWNGLLGDLYNGEKNFTINYFTITLERLQYFDSSVPYFWEGFGFAIKMPPPLPKWQNLLYPFTWKVWVSVMAAVMFLPLVFYALNLTRAPEESKDTLVDSFVYTIMSFLRQGVPHVPSRGLERTAILSWWIGGMIITMSYTSNLIAVLTIPVFPAKLSTVHDLATSSYRIGMLDYGEFVPEALATSKDSDLLALGNRMDLFYMNNDETDEYILYNGTMIAMMEGTHAITETYSYLRILLQGSDIPSENYYFLKDHIYSGSLAFFFQKHTPWTYKFNSGIRRLVEAGLINKWHSDMMGRENTAANENINNPLSTDHLQGPFMIYMVGAAVSICIFVLELATKLRKQKTDGED